MHFAVFLLDHERISQYTDERKALSLEVMQMKQARWSTTVRAGVLASSLLLLPLTLPTFAQMRDTAPAPNTQVAETRDDNDNTGLWGLLGLAGLAGLLGRRRHVEPARSYTDTRQRSSV
jgi:MYXO-CTERM domain-containing protein